MCQIGVHVIGAGHGECVIVEFPDHSVGVIDPYCGSCAGMNEKNRAELHPIIRLLENTIKPPVIQFVAVTHPHADHCMGTAHFLWHFSHKIEKLWIWPAFPNDGVMKYLCLLKAKMRKEMTEERLLLPPGTILNELYKIRDWHVKYNDKVEYLGESHVVKTTLKNNCGVVIAQFFAPTHQFLGDVYEQMASLWDKVHRNGHDITISSVELTTEPNLNHYSSVIVLQWERTKFLLCSDTEADTWDYILEKQRKLEDAGNDFGVDWVKIGHHGSHTGYNADLLALLQKHQPVGVLTPFYRGKKESRLPSETGLAGLGKCFTTIHTTCMERSKHGKWRQESPTGRDVETEAVPVSWVGHIAHQPDIAKAFAFLPTDDLGDWTPDDFELPIEWYTDISNNPQLVRMFRPAIQDKIESVLSDVFGGLENIFRVSHWFDFAGNLIRTIPGKGTGLYDP